MHCEPTANSVNLTSLKQRRRRRRRDVDHVVQDQLASSAEEQTGCVSCSVDLVHTAGVTRRVTSRGQCTGHCENVTLKPRDVERCRSMQIFVPRVNVSLSVAPLQLQGIL